MFSLIKVHHFLFSKLFRFIEPLYILKTNFRQSIRTSNFPTPLYLFKNSSSSELEEENKEGRIIDYLKEKVQYWIKNEMNKSKNVSSPMRRQSALRCKICLEHFNVDVLEKHAYLCKEKAQFRQQLRNLRFEFKKSEAMSKELIRKLQVEMNLEKYQQ